MSKCTRCLEGSCKRHPLLDHGKRAASIKEKMEETMKKSNALSNNSNSNPMQIQLSKQQILNNLISQAKKEKEQDNLLEDQSNQYKIQMELERLKAESKKRKNISSEQQHLAMNSGLHSSVINAMLDSDSDNSNDYNSESSYSDSSEEKDKKRSKKHKKSNKDHHKEHKQKKSKSKSKSHKHKKSRTK